MSVSVSIARASPLKTAPLCRARGCLHRLSKCPPQNKAIPDGVRYGTLPIPYVYIYILDVLYSCLLRVGDDDHPRRAESDDSNIVCITRRDDVRSFYIPQEISDPTQLRAILIRFMIRGVSLTTFCLPLKTLSLSLFNLRRLHERGRRPHDPRDRVGEYGHVRRPHESQPNRWVRHRRPNDERSHRGRVPSESGRTARGGVRAARRREEGARRDGVRDFRTVQSFWTNGGVF